MTYFSKFPKINYDIRGDGQLVTMTNITKRLRVRDAIKKNFVGFDFYDVKEGETPEYIANEVYGDTGFHWLILLSNDILDVYTDWPMSSAQFERYVYSKYDDVNEIHHYEYTQESGDTSFVIELPNESATTIPMNATAITNYEYEVKVQEKKRRIRIIKPDYINTIKNEFKAKMNG